MFRKYPFKAVEKKWRPYWEELGLYRTEDESDKPRHYILDYFPYPSGAGLSVGHCRNYVPTCISARYLRMRGYNVLHPMGWDAFGLPAENYAIEHGAHPAETSRRHAATYKRQLQLIECSYDWSREVSSADPEYYRWTQWFFLLLYRRGLAYRAPGEQWWCPHCQTILANEQVESGRCWRCSTPVTKKRLQQWYFKITAYADRLIDDLETVAWPEGIKAMQRNWIGRSEGAEITFTVEDHAAVPAKSAPIETFTTRPDTLFGVTFLALAPEHALLPDLATPERQEAVAAYIAAARRRSEIERQAPDPAQSGVFTGRYACHPLSGARIPIWVADYVLASYGSGAIMGVPAHDERDHAFARAHDLPVLAVIRPADGAAVADPYSGEGELVNSGPYDGLPTAAARERICADLERADSGARAVNYKLRDWLISRQRYWGAPIPIVHCPQCGIVPVPETALPVRLPEIENYAPGGDGRSPLARVEAWVNTDCPRCGGPARRETDTMDGFACSSWYFLRFASPHEQERPFDPQAVNAWLPVDTYVGGAEHAVMHLLYARFWTKVMYDAGLVNFHEPFQTLRNQGVLHAADRRRMSKSRGNVVTPDEVVATHGVDALRTYVVFLGPFEASVIWDESGIKGVTRFLDRLWMLARRVAGLQPVAAGTPTANGRNERAFVRQQHETMRRVGQDMTAFKFNTAVAALMEWLNYLQAQWQQGEIGPGHWREALKTFSLLLAPIAPFITEEIWQNLLGEEGSVHRQPWPAYDEAALQAKQVTVAVQVNGRVRDTITVEAGADEETVTAVALAAANVRRHVQEKPVRRTIVVPDRLINIVV